jgi:hypothetical protein
MTPTFGPGFVRIKAKFSSNCACGKKIRAGKEIYWHPEHKLVRCVACGPKPPALPVCCLCGRTRHSPAWSPA